MQERPPFRYFMVGYIMKTPGYYCSVQEQKRGGADLITRFLWSVRYYCIRDDNSVIAILIRIIDVLDESYVGRTIVRYRI